MHNDELDESERSQQLRLIKCIHSYCRWSERAFYRRTALGDYVFSLYDGVTSVHKSDRQGSSVHLLEIEFGRFHARIGSSRMLLHELLPKLEAHLVLDELASI